MNDNLQIIFETQKQIIIQIQIKMFQFWKFDNFMSLIYSFLFDFRKDENFDYEDVIDMLMNNIINFLKKINNSDFLKGIEKDFNEKHYNIIPEENKKNQLNKISEEYELYPEKSNNDNLLVNNEDNWFNIYKQNNNFIKNVNKIFKYIIPFLSKLYKLFNTKIRKIEAEKKTIKDFLDKENLQELFNNFKKCLEELKTMFNITFDEKEKALENNKLFYFLNIDDNELFKAIKDISKQYNDILNLIGENLHNNQKISKSKKIFDFQSENILPFLIFKNTTNYENENELNIEKILINNYNNYLIIDNKNEKLSLNLNKNYYFDSIQFENNLLSIFSNKFLIDLSQLSFPLFIFDKPIGKIPIIKKFKSKYEEKEEIDNKIKEEIINFMKEKKNNDEVISCFNQYYNLLFFITNKNEKIEMKNVMNIISNTFIKNKEFLKLITSTLKIENLLPLLELIEENCYQIFEDGIDNKFHNNDYEKIEKEKKKLNKKNEKIIEKFILALRRFILRIIYDNEDLDPDEKIIEYIKEDDFWNDEDVDTKFLDKITIEAKNSIEFYKSLQKRKDNDNDDDEIKIKKKKDKKIQRKKRDKDD